MQKISAVLHHYGSHGVPTVSNKWKTAESRFRKAHSCVLWKLAQRGVVQDKY